MPSLSFPESRIPCPPHNTSVPLDLQLLPPTGHCCMDNYKLIKPLGHGNMGTVLLAALRDTDKLFALKVISKEALIKHDAVQRAIMEREILSELRHSFFPTLQAHFETEKQQVLVLDYCPGGDLNSLRQKQPDKKFTETVARFYVAEIVLALDHLHKLGYVYRDLKPENVLVQSTGHIMLTDFDLCLKMARNESKPPKGKAWLKSSQLLSVFPCLGTEVDDRDVTKSHDLVSGKSPMVKKQVKHKQLPSSTTRVTPLDPKKSGSTVRSHSLVGTEEYVPPEMIWATGHDYAVDWWTLGVLLYELVYGTTPFKSYSRKETFFNIVSKEPKLSGPWCPLHDLIRKLLAKEPSQRLGFKAGADEIKTHAFFEGLSWDKLQYVARPPNMPSALTLEEMVGLDGVNLEEHLDFVERERAGRSKPSTRTGLDRSPPQSYGEQKFNSNRSPPQEKYSSGHGNIDIAFHRNDKTSCGDRHSHFEVF